jgi:hypothetical protein
LVISSGTAELNLQAGAADCPSAYNEFGNGGKVAMQGVAQDRSDFASL